MNVPISRMLRWTDDEISRWIKVIRAPDGKEYTKPTEIREALMSMLVDYGIDEVPVRKPRGEHES